MILRIYVKLHQSIKYYTKKINGLKQDWSREVVFCNPPYGDNPTWFKKIAESKAKTVVALVPARIGTNYWFNYVYPYATQIAILRGRLYFENSSTASPFDSVIILFGKGNLDCLKTESKIIKL